ncbi:MAG: hypothetical protein Q8S73_17765 [Deltaproteobacteria bacterium]|nr:hypothetical protein [Myxococcales bacterium]MDP3215959.1 hypothetical protein [Deltaproteobacteria bacterium]
MCQIVGPNDAIASILGVPAVSGPPPTQVPAVVAVMSAIWAVHESALACPRDGSAPVRATVTFARAGRVSAVAFTPSRRRSREAECISRALRAATVPAFLNDSYVVTYELPAAGVADGGTVAGAGTLTVPWTGERTRFEDSGAVIHETITLPLQPTLRREFEGPDMAEVRSQLRAAVVPCLPDPSSIASVDVVFDSAGRVTRQSVSTSTAYRECIEHGLASLHFTVAPFAAPYCRVQENFRGAGAERPIVTSNLREEPHSTAAPPTAPAPRVLTQEDLDGMRRELRRLAEGLTTCGTAFDNPSGALVLTVSPDGTVARAGFRTMNPIAEEGIRCATTIARTWTFAPFPGPAVQLSTVILLPRRRE